MNPSAPSARRFSHHEEAAVRVRASLAEAFEFLDDPHHLSAHMDSSSPMMAGGSMRIETDGLRGRAVGSHIRLAGKVLGIALELDEVVVEHEPPRRKVWETLGKPRLLIIGGYRMGFEVEPVDDASRVRLWIDYDLPDGRLVHWLGRMLGRFYARWCTDRMLRQVDRHFPVPAVDA